VAKEPGPSSFQYLMAVVEYCMLLKRMVLKNSQLAEVAKGKEKKELDRLMRDSKVLSEPSFPSPLTRLVLARMETYVSYR